MRVDPQNMGNVGKPKQAKGGKMIRWPRWWIECILAFSLIAFLIFLTLPNSHRGRVESPRTASANNLHQIGIAMHDYHLYLEEQSLYSDFKLDEPWDSPDNMALLERMPSVFGLPIREKAKERCVTHYQVFTGGGAIFQASPQDRLLTLREIAGADGTSRTLLVVEADDPVPWTKPEDLPYSPDQPLPKLGGLFPDGFNGLMADGSVRRFPRDLNEKTIRAAITWNDGEQVKLPE